MQFISEPLLFSLFNTIESTARHEQQSHSRGVILTLRLGEPQIFTLNALHDLRF
jgi:hypothetical protein